MSNGSAHMLLLTVRQKNNEELLYNRCMKKKTMIKIKYALRAQKQLFRHPTMDFMVGSRSVTMYEFIRVGWKAIDALIKDK